MSETLQESEELEKPETAAGKELRQMGWTLALTTAQHAPLLLDLQRIPRSDAEVRVWGDAVVLVHCSTPISRHSLFPGDLATSKSRRAEVRERWVLAEVQSGIWPTQAVAGSLQRLGNWATASLCNLMQDMQDEQRSPARRSFLESCEP